MVFFIFFGLFFFFFHIILVGFWRVSFLSLTPFSIFFFIPPALFTSHVCGSGKDLVWLSPAAAGYT